MTVTLGAGGRIFVLFYLLSVYLVTCCPFCFQRRSFDKRQAQLRPYVHETPYARAKDRLRADFEKFLAVRSVCPPPANTAASLFEASSLDVIRFLHHRDGNGRTQVHAFSCPHMGLLGLFDCGCPRHFAAGTVDSYVGQLRAVFNALGRRDKDNPCDTEEVKGWVKASAKEQQRHRVPVKQARPTFSTHLRLLVKEIMYRLALLPSSAPLFPQRFTLLRDWTFFVTQWFCGDRAGDLGRALGMEVVRLDDGSLLYNHTVGKTIRGAGGHLLVVPKVEEEPSLCPVAAFDRYVAACKSGGLDLRKGYLFPPTSSPLHLSIKDGPLSSTAATKRLRLYLPSEDLTAHGARAGCAITLLMLGASSETVMEHCRWATAQVARHYSKIERVRRLDSSARILQSAVVLAEGVSDSDSAACLYDLLDSGFSQIAAI